MEGEMKEQIPILLIEDNPGDADLIRLLLADEDRAEFEIVWVSRLAAAFDRLKEQEFRLVMVDPGLPDSSGMDTIRKLRQAVCDLPIVVITDNNDEETGLAALREGAQDYLIKGRFPDDFLARVLCNALERNQVQKRLNESERFLRSTLDALTSHIAILDDKGMILLVNKAWQQFAAANHADPGKVMEGADYLAVCENIRDGETEAGARDFAAGIRSVMKGGSDFFEMEYPCHSPEEKRWFVGRVSPFCGEGDHRVVVAHENITLRKLAELENVKSLELLNETQRLSRVGGWKYDLVDGKIHWTDEVYRIYGLEKERYDPSDIPKDIDFYAPEDRKRIEEAFQRAVTEGRSYDLELRFHAADGRRLWVRTLGHAEWQDGKINRVSGNIMDVTESRHARDSLLESELRLQTILDAISDNIILLDSDLKIQWPNLAACKFAGLPREELIGRFCFEALQMGSGICADCPVEQAVRTGRMQMDTRTDSQGRTLSIKGCPVRDVAGKIIGVVEMSEDVSERLSLEEQLRQAQKMETIGLLAGGIAHDFNNILSAIIGYSELAQQRNLFDEVLSGYLANVLKAGHRAKNLVHRILAFSRQAETRYMPVKIGYIIKEILKMIRATLPATITIHQKIHGDGWVMGDPTQIHQVIMNLCINAHHAMRENGGDLGVSISVEDMAGETAGSSGLSAKPYLRVDITDTGVGMDETVLSRLFEPYFTTKIKGEGTGLGLSVAFGIMQSHGGMIRVESKIGKGSVFHLYFPKLDDPVSPAFVHEPESIPSGSERILVVDDEAALTDLMKRLLESLGYQVTAYNDPLAALRDFRNDPELYDLAIVDMTMPQMTGDILARELMNVRPGLPVMVCTGFSERMDKDKAKSSGIRAVLEKPFERKDLAGQVRHVLDSSLQAGACLAKD
ncbi:MAG: response regulator [Desulfobacteraceae bacterium]|nr:MAG: response regulator [Desulfobacteraceae bacterium]